MRARGTNLLSLSATHPTFPNLSSNDKPRQENRGSSHRIFAQSLRIESLRPPSRSIMDKIDSSMIRLVVEPPLIEDVCSYELHPLPKNVFSSRLVSTFAITTHPPRCCEDHARLTKANARLVADKLLTSSPMAKSQKKPGGLRPIIAIAMAHPIASAVAMAVRTCLLASCFSTHPLLFHRQSFHFDTRGPCVLSVVEIWEDTGPAYTQMKLQHRSRASHTCVELRTCVERNKWQALC